MLGDLWSVLLVAPAPEIVNVAVAVLERRVADATNGAAGDSNAVNNDVLLGVRGGRGDAGQGSQGQGEDFLDGNHFVYRDGGSRVLLVEDEG